MHDAYSALREPDFRRFVTMRFCMVLAGAIQSVCTMWWVYELTKSPMMLGLTGLFEAIPAILLSLYGGHLADKLNRRTIVLSCLVFSFFTWVFLASLPFLQNILTQNWLIGGIYSVSVFVGIMRAFYSPAAFSLLGQLVSKENLGNAITWNSTAWEVANLGGLSIGGFLYGWFGVKIVFLLVVNVLLLLAGNFMEPSSIVLIMAPILFPVAVKLGIHPVHLGILMVVNMEVGMCHPPVGLNLYVASGIAKMGITELTIAVWPWLLTMLIFLGIVTYVPEISLWLPRMLGML